MCDPYFNLMSICKPKTLIFVLGSIWVLALLINAVILNLLEFLNQ